MAITFVANAAIAAVAANPPTVNMTLPALSADDIIIIFVVSKSVSVPTNEIDTPTGYTEVGTRQSIDIAGAGNDMRTALFYKRATAGDSGASVTISRQGTDTLLLAAVAAVYRGCITTGSPFDTTGIAAATDATDDTDVISFPAFDPTATDVRVVYAGVRANDWDATVTASFINDGTTFNKDFEDETLTGSDCGFVFYSADRNGNALAQADVDLGQTAATGTHVGYSFALLPPAAGGAAVPAPYYANYYLPVVLEVA